MKMGLPLTAPPLHGMLPHTQWFQSQLLSQPCHPLQVLGVPQGKVNGRKTPTSVFIHKMGQVTHQERPRR